MTQMDLNQPYITEINPLSLHVLPFLKIHAWIWYANILLRNFVFFTMSISLQVFLNNTFILLWYQSNTDLMKYSLLYFLKYVM